MSAKKRSNTTHTTLKRVIFFDKTPQNLGIATTWRGVGRGWVTSGPGKGWDSEESRGPRANCGIATWRMFSKKPARLYGELSVPGH